MCAVAYFWGHAGRGFFPLLNGGELAALYAFVFLYLAAAGGGAWSVDRAVRGRTNTTYPSSRTSRVSRSEVRHTSQLVSERTSK